MTHSLLLLEHLQAQVFNQEALLYETHSISTSFFVSNKTLKIQFKTSTGCFAWCSRVTKKEISGNFALILGAYNVGMNDGRSLALPPKSCVCLSDRLKCAKHCRLHYLSRWLQKSCQSSTVNMWSNSQWPSAQCSTSRKSACLCTLTLQDHRSLRGQLYRIWDNSKRRLWHCVQGLG